VRQSYGNCNRYIQARTPDLIQSGNPQLPRILSNTDRLSIADQDLLHHADTFFIASAYFNQQQQLTQGADVSHRGGRPGFIRIDDDQSLTIPDFAGNLFFNTIGNLLHDPRVGLLFIDFESADLLYLAGEAHMIWDGPEVDAFTGAQRLIQVRLHQVRRVTHALPIRWSSVRYSDFLRGTGTWQEADLKLRELHGALP
ncbi:MAG: pyridoxamine 5'-phosphate oxidase family protein, partial [Herbaspirillum sp.]